jgi:hypothetical protein
VVHQLQSSFPFAFVSSFDSGSSTVASLSVSPPLRPPFDCN